ncbi:MAG: hypothetical protein QOE77_1940 [Blastocatellia bacterium]|jgi:hypothetical protein|nr:hypothetical protein [Blastocatellia bacterium]
MPKVPEEETLRRIRDMQRLALEEHKLDAIKQIRKMGVVNFPEMQDEARMVENALAAIAVNHRQDIAKIASEIAGNLRPILHESLVGNLVLVNPPYGIQQTLTDIAANAASAFKNLQSTPDFRTILKSIQTANDTPLRLALETIRNWNLDARNELFAEFVDDALNQVTPLTEAALEILEKEHLPKRKINELTRKERLDLNLLIGVLTILIGIYTAWKMGQPIDINPEQIAKLSQPSINITNIFQALNPTPVYYLVVHDCKLIPKPSRTKTVIYALAPGAKVKLIVTNHQWVYVYYEEGDVKKEGWIRKKYLKRLP